MVPHCGCSGLQFSSRRLGGVEGDSSALPFPKEVAQDVLDAAPNTDTADQLPGNQSASEFQFTTDAFKGHEAAAMRSDHPAMDTVR
jgi:hypothetical protein